jgi:YD repeat-containing protein
MKRLLVSSVAVLSVAMVGCPQKESSRSKETPPQHVELTPKAKIAMKMPRQICGAYLDRIQAAHAGGKDKEAIAYSAGLIRYLRRTPLAQLQSCEQSLARHVHSKGVSPFLSVIIDHQYRLARVATQAGATRLRRFAATIRSAIRKPFGDQEGTVIFRNSRDTGLVAYSENAGLAVALTGTTRIGLSIYARGGRPEDVLRTIEFLRQCDETSKTPHARRTFAIAMKRCDLLLGTALQHGALSDLRTAAGNIVPALGRGAKACLGSLVDDPTSRMIGAIEDRAECMQSAQSDPVGLNPWSGLASATQIDPPHKAAHKAIKDRLKDHSLKDRDDYDWSDKGVTGQISNFQYENNAGDSLQVLEVSKQVGESWANSTSKTHTIVIENTENGETTTGYDSSGHMTEQWTFNNDGTALQQKFDADGNVVAEVKTDGNVVEVTQTEDGETKKTTYQYNDETKKMECMSGCEDPAVYEDASGSDTTSSTTLPPDDMMSAPCAEYAFDQPDRGQSLGTLDPLINPNPDAEPEMVDDPCMLGLLGSQPTKCPPSVALCVEAPPSGQCGCGGTSTIGGKIPTGTGRCAAMNCGADATCDPETGACSGGAAGRPLFPGSVPPAVGGIRLPGRPGPGSNSLTPGAPR